MLHNNKDFAGKYMYSDDECDYSVVNSATNDHSFTRYFGSDPGEYESYPLLSLQVSTILNSPAWVKKLLKVWIKENPSCVLIDNILSLIYTKKERMLNDILSLKDIESTISKEIFIKGLTEKESFLFDLNNFICAFRTSLVIARSKNFFSHLSDDDIKRLSKKLKESAKDVRNGRQRKFFTSASEYVLEDDVFDFITLQTKYFYETYNQVKQDSFSFSF